MNKIPINIDDISSFVHINTNVTLQSDCQVDVETTKCFAKEFLEKLSTAAQKNTLTHKYHRRLHLAKFVPLHKQIYVLCGWIASTQTIGHALDWAGS